MKNLIKKWFKLYDRQDIEKALASLGHASSRDDFEWKLRIAIYGKDWKRP